MSNHTNAKFTMVRMAPENDKANEPADNDKEEAATEGNESGDSLVPRTMVEAFRQQQRLLASLDFGAINAASLATANFGAIKALHDGVARAVSQSIDFNALQKAAHSIQAVSNWPTVPLRKNEWSKTFVQAIDLSAIIRANELVLNSAAIWKASQVHLDVFAAISKHFDYSALTKQLTSAFKNIDWEQLRETVESWLPENLLTVADLEEVAHITLEEGLPLAWVPRADIVHDLVKAGTREARLHILSERFNEILDDCEAALVSIAHDWADQCRNAISVLRQPGLDAPAQSHAGNIIDSIVLTILGTDGRTIAKQRASEPYGDLPLRVAGENLALRPLFLGFSQWWPAKGYPIPDHFVRHVTAHAVGQPGVFTPHNALVAVMLASSLTIQFWQDAGVGYPPS